MIPESQFLNSVDHPRRKSRRMRKNYDVKVLPDAQAKGKCHKGQAWRKRIHVKGRRPVSGDRLQYSDDAIYWLRVRRV